MDIYVDAKYYKDTFKGDLIPDDVIERWLEDASADIDSLTYNRIKRVGFENLTEHQKNIIQKSVCMHADFSYQYGDWLDSPISSYSAGTTSVSIKDMNIAGQNGIMTSKKVFTYLKQSALTQRLF